MNARRYLVTTEHPDNQAIRVPILETNSFRIAAAGWHRYQSAELFDRRDGVIIVPG